MIVVDTSAALSALLAAGPARCSLAEQQLHVPHPIDSEIASGLRRRVAAGEVPADAAWASLRVWQQVEDPAAPRFGQRLEGALHHSRSSVRTGSLAGPRPAVASAVKPSAGRSASSGP